MKKKKVRLTAILLAAVMALTACGGNTPQKTENAGTTAQTQAPATKPQETTQKPAETTQEQTLPPATEEPTTEAPTTQAPTTKAEPTTEAEYTGEMKIAFGGYVLAMESNPLSDFDFSQILTLREDRTCSLLGEEYTWTAKNSTSIKLWNGEIFAGTVYAEMSNGLKWNDPDGKEKKTFVRNKFPEDYSAVFKLVINHRRYSDSEAECASEIVFGPQWEVLIGEKTYHAFLNSEQLYLYGDDGSIAFSDRDLYGESYKEYPWESGILELFIRITDEHGFHNEGYASYVDESRFDIVELTVDNFMDYFELVSCKGSYKMEKDAFGDVAGFYPYNDYVRPKESVELFDYTVKFSRKGRDRFDVIYHPSDKTVTLVMTGEEPDYENPSWIDRVESWSSNSWFDWGDGEKIEKGYLYLSLYEPFRTFNIQSFYSLANAEKVGDDYIWRNCSRMKGFIPSRVLGQVAIRKDSGQ